MTTEELLRKATARPWRKLPAPSTPEPHEVGEAFANHELQLRAVNSFEAVRERAQEVINAYGCECIDDTKPGHCPMCGLKAALALMEGNQ